MKVEVYFNLHKRVFSVRSCKTGRVIHHTKDIQIYDPQFVVREGGRQRVLRERKKNVHAFVRGYVTHEDFIFDLSFEQWSTSDKKDTIGYNPYKYDSFVNVTDEEPVYKAFRAWLNVRRYFGRDVPKIQAEGVQ